MRHLFIALTALIVALGLAAAGCGKKDEGGAKKEGKAQKSEESAAEPTKEDIEKWDCDKACAQQLECYKESGMKVDADQAKKACMMGCKAMKSSYDPKMHGKTAKVFATFAAGKCK